MVWVVYEVHRGLPTIEYFGNGDYGYEPTVAYVEREGSADRFECGVCRLKLEGREYLVEAGVPLEVELEPDDASEEELADYGEVQVDSYIQSMIDERRGKWRRRRLQSSVVDPVAACLRQPRDTRARRLLTSASRSHY